MRGDAEMHLKGQFQALEERRIRTMGDAYLLAVPTEKKTYWLGSISPARYCLPLLLEEKCVNKNVILFHDGGYQSDKYDGANECGDGGSEGYIGVSFDSYPVSKNEWVEQHVLQKEEFINLLNRFNGDKSLIYLGDMKFKTSESIK